jgi:hypothetical protein
MREGKSCLMVEWEGGEVLWFFMGRWSSCLFMVQIFLFRGELCSAQGSEFVTSKGH